MTAQTPTLTDPTHTVQSRGSLGCPATFVGPPVGAASRSSGPLRVLGWLRHLIDEQLSEVRRQRRGARGARGAASRDDDDVLLVLLGLK